LLERCEKNRLSKFKSALRRVEAEIGRKKGNCCTTRRIFILYYQIYIVDLIIGSILIDAMEKAKKNDFNFDGKSQKTTISTTLESDIIH